jgi:glutamate decarboxylase
MDAENLLTAEQVLDACDENTIAVIVTFGQTFTGKFEGCRCDQLCSR